MSDGIVIAIIGAAATIIAAVIATMKKNKGNSTVIKQKNKGKKDSIQIGVINVNKGETRDEQ